MNTLILVVNSLVLVADTPNFIVHVLILFENPLVLLAHAPDLIAHVLILLEDRLILLEDHLVLLKNCLILSLNLPSLVLHRGQHLAKLVVHSHLREAGHGLGIGCQCGISFSSFPGFARWGY